jgi:predicted class III extradiol MEMO1 family dioxygenase
MRTQELLDLPAACAGVCYPKQPDELRSFFKEALKEAPRPPKRTLTVPQVLIVPHIDFRVNLSLYATAYRRLLALKQFPEHVVILGVGHRCPHDFSVVPCRFQTPLGDLSSDPVRIARLEELAGLPLGRSPATFLREHSLEFVAVWLQALRDLHFPESAFTVTPVLLGGLHDAVFEEALPGPGSEWDRFSKGFGAWLRELPASTLLIASIDGCHVGPRFDHTFPSDAPIQARVRKWEKELWKRCRHSKLEEFFSWVCGVQNGYYFDGVGVLTLLLQNIHASAALDENDLWYEPSDNSFVTFSGGVMIPEASQSSLSAP